MKQGTVKFSKEFVTPIGLHEWLSIELPIGEKIESEVIRQSFEDAQNAVMEFHKQSNQGMLDNSIAPAPPPIITVERTSQDIRIAELIKDIYACTELKGDNGLLSYSKVAAITSWETQQAYDIMFRKLSPQ